MPRTVAGTSLAGAAEFSGFAQPALMPLRRFARTVGPDYGRLLKMKSLNLAGAALGGLALAVLAPAAASAQPLNLDTFAGPLLDTPCTFVQVEKALNAKPALHPAAPEVAGQLAGLKPEYRAQAQKAFDQPPAQRRQTFAMYKQMMGSQSKPPTDAEAAKYKGLPEALASNCQRF